MSTLGLRVAVLMQSFSQVQEAPWCDHLQHKNTNPGLGCMNAAAGIQSLSTQYDYPQDKERLYWVIHLPGSLL